MKNFINENPDTMKNLSPGTGKPGLKFPLRLLMPLLLTCMALPACRQGKHADKADQKPNIVLIVADDLGYGDLGCYGASKISTPAIDELAAGGMRFVNAYASSSLCSPSRYSILTGRYAWRTRLKYGVLKYFDRPLIEMDRTTVASMMKRNGYHTACIGKWHLGLEWQLNENAPADPEQSVFNSWAENLQDFIDFSKPVGGGPTDLGFDYFFGMAGSNNMMPYVFIENDGVTEPPSEPQKAYDHYMNAKKAPNWDIRTINQVLTRRAVGVIHDHFRDHGTEPLFLYFPASAIHRPCLPTFTKGNSGAGLRGDMVAELDWTVAEIVKALKEEHAYRNTVLVFTSDNGPRPGDPVYWLDQYKLDEEDLYLDYFDDYQPSYVDPNGNRIWKNGWLTYGHRASGIYLGFKSDAWDGGLRVPLIVHWPGKVKGGGLCRNNVCLSDLMETFADMIGDSLLEGEGRDSYSFYSSILDPASPQARTSMTLTGGSSGAFVEIQDEWKYIEAAVPGRWPETFYPDGPSKFDHQLYHLSDDPSEQKNLYDWMPEKVSEMKDRVSTVKMQAGTEGK
jgi:arylsulfatase A